MQSNNNTQLPPEYRLLQCKYRSVNEFLHQLNLDQYLSIFLFEGFDSMTSLLEITEEDMTVMNVKRGHRRLIQREIATIKGVSRNQPIVTNILGQKCTPEIYSGVKVEEKGHSLSNFNPTNYIINGNSTMTSASNNSSNNGASTICNHNVLLAMSPQSMNSGLGSSTCGGSNNRFGFKKDQINVPKSSISSHISISSNSNNNSCNSSVSSNGGSSSCSSISSSVSSSGDNPKSHNKKTTDSASLSDSPNSSISSTENVMIESAPAKRKYRRHPKPDRNAPIKPLSAYVMFSNDSRAELKDQNLTFAELAKLVGDKWKKLSRKQRQVYERLATQAKDEYLVALEQYKKTYDYQRYKDYLKEFKTKQEAANRMIGRAKKRIRQAPSSESNSGGMDTGINGSSHSSANMDKRETSDNGTTHHSGDNHLQEHYRNNNVSTTPVEANCEVRLRKHQPSVDSGYTSQQSSYTNRDEDGYRSDKMMRGLLSVEFINNTKDDKPRSYITRNNSKRLEGDNRGQ
ncbi:MAG: hypothetical protein EXX96DRAFT_554490 [Benjaminiella poitrasii]|nr:MAG: hypothetical protein EXX96DRAFT_554490 [Benjaminiella poitrasii]